MIKVLFSYCRYCINNFNISESSSHFPDGIPNWMESSWSIADSCHDRLPVPWIPAGIKSSPAPSETVIPGSSSGVIRQTKVGTKLSL